MITVTLLLLLAALVIVIAAAMGKSPEWPAIVLLIVVELLQVVPK
jgi:hypothetical protein